MTQTKASLKQDERTDAARRRLIEAAVEVLATEGFRRTTFSRIQDVAGISRGLIGYHFGTKQALIEAVVHSIQDAYWEQSNGRASRELSGLDALRASVDTYLERLSRDSRPAKVMLVLGTESISENPSIRDAIRQGYADLRNELQGFIERGKEDGSIRDDVDPVGHAAIFEAVIRGVVLQFLVDPAAFELQAARAAANSVVAQLAAPPATENGKPRSSRTRKSVAPRS